VTTEQTEQRRPIITLGQGINLGLVVVLLGAAWQLGEKMADMRVYMAQAQGAVDVLSARVETLSRQQDQMRADLKDVISEMRGIRDEAKPR
jgi:outer membrane murein-binding lipoprotein Lpp